MVFAITGTPGTGKSSVARLLKKRFAVLELNLAVKMKRLYCDYDRRRKTYIVDTKAATKFVSAWINKQKKDVFIVSHISHLLNISYDAVFLLKAKPEVLYKRLMKKGWNKKKIMENVEAEIFDVISEEIKGKKIVIDTTVKSPRGVARDIYKFVKTIKQHECDTKLRRDA